MNKLLKTRAERRLLEAASRYIEKPECTKKSITEKKVVDPESNDEYDIDDEILSIAALHNGKLTKADILSSIKSNNYTAKLEKIRGIVNPEFNKLIPKINDIIGKNIEKAVDIGAVYVKNDDWCIPDNIAFKIQNGIYNEIVVPEYRTIQQTLGKAAGSNFRRAWELHVGIVKTLEGDHKFDAFRRIAKQYLDASSNKKHGATEEVEVPTEVEVPPTSTRKRRSSRKKVNTESAFYKTMCSILNEHLKHLYAKKYKVSLHEANKMFTVNDKKVL